MFGKLVNGELIYAPKILNGTVNPSEGRLRQDGFLPVLSVSPPTVGEGFTLDPKWEQDGDKIVQKWRVLRDRSPMSADEIAVMYARQHIQDIEADDNTALRMKAFYPTFDSVIGQTVKLGFKFTHADKLWRVVQPELTIQAHYPPGLGAESLYEEICEAHDGTLEDPIPYNGNMALENGKYYIQNGAIYLCNRDTVNPVYHPLAELVGIYVEKV